MHNENADYDSPWKEALQRYFEPFMALCYPQIHQDIDWLKGHEFLDKELQKVVRKAGLGRRTVDKLVKVTRKTGAETFVLIHIEVQGRIDAAFGERMYVYHYRVFDRYRLPVVSLALLADDSETWRSCDYGYALWGCRMQLDFPSVKLLDYRARWRELETSLNPFAIMIMAHLQTRVTRDDAVERLRNKLSLVKSLYQKGFSRQDILELYRFIDWLMVLPEILAERFDQEITHYEETLHMPYITSTERAGIKKGIQQGILQGVQQGIQQGIQQGVHQGMQIGEANILKRQLSRRFGDLPEDVARRLDTAKSADLEIWSDRVLEAKALSEIFH